MRGFGRVLWSGLAAVALFGMAAAPLHAQGKRVIGISHGLQRP